MTDSFSKNSGGRTQSIFNRAKLLADYAEKSYILTFNFKRDYGEIVESVIIQREIPDSIEFLNVYEFFAGEKIYLSSKIENVPFKKEENLDYRYVEGKNAYKVFKGEVQVHYVQLNKKGSVTYRDTFDEKKRKIKRDIFDSLGNIIKTSYFNMQTQNIIRQDFFTKGGRLYLRIESDRTTGDTIQCISFDQDQKIKNKFVNEDEMNKFWIGTLNELHENGIFFCEYRWLDHTLIDNRYTTRKIKSVAQIHSRHLNSPYHFGSQIRKYNGLALSNLSDYSAIVLLTKHQYQHVINQFGYSPNLYRIPHHAIEQKVSRLKRKNDNKIIVVSRFVKLKRIFDILKAFKIAYAELPKLKLELWGAGEEEAKYQTFIDENNLGEAVTIKGYTTNPHEVFYSGGISIITSKFEGFGITILESMSNKTPVIAYDFYYGPRELIDNNENGYIVEDGNIGQLAEKIIYLQKNKKVLKEFSKKAEQKIMEFKPEVIKEKWLKVIHDVELDEDRHIQSPKQKVLLSEVERISIKKEVEEYQLHFHIKNALTAGTPNEKYFLYLDNYFNLDEIGNRFIELMKERSNGDKEWLKGVFTVNSSVYNELKEMDLKLSLGINNGNDFQFVDILFDGKIDN
ncbi:glycosyltransferase [Gracilibacillus alcaliphilus]|uniref:glycosyltransferase n=1 Tax=Gracilibacillus alcaliphilus TaxID=1401441 RepID=UPI00195B3283|nr:glycosyltransferase [Gracilibacillus alcaliphilus]